MPIDTAENQTTPMHKYETIPTVKINGGMKLVLPNGRITSLVNTILGHLQESSKSAIIHFTSANKGVSAGVVACETAYYLASNEGKKVLFLDTDSNAPYEGILAKKNLCDSEPIDLYLSQNAERAPLVNLEGTNFSYGCIGIEDKSGNLKMKIADIKYLLDTLQQDYDIIIMHSSNAVKNDITSIISPISAGTVVVVEAEKTRMPVVEELINIVNLNGGKILGSVMTGRKYYIPKIIYKIFFSGKFRD